MKTRSQGTQSQEVNKGCIEKQPSDNSSDDGSYIACNDSQYRDDSQLFTPERTNSPGTGQGGRSSERIRSRKNKRFRMPSREDVFKEISDADEEGPTTITPNKRKRSNLSNSFSRVTHSYNQEYVSENEGSSMDEFLVDDDDVSDAVDSDTGNKVESQKKSVRRRIITRSSSSSEEEAQPTASEKKRRRRRVLPSSSSSEDDTQDVSLLPTVPASSSLGGLDLVSPVSRERDEQSQADDVQSDASESLISQTSIRKKISDSSVATEEDVIEKNKENTETVAIILESNESGSMSSPGNPLEDEIETVKVDNSVLLETPSCSKSTECKEPMKSEATSDDAEVENTKYYAIFNKGKKKSSASKAKNECVEDLENTSEPVKTARRDQASPICESGEGYCQDSLALVSDDEDSSIIIESGEEGSLVIVSEDDENEGLKLNQSSRSHKRLNVVEDSLIIECDEEIDNMDVSGIEMNDQCRLGRGNDGDNAGADNVSDISGVEAIHSGSAHDTSESASGTSESEGESEEDSDGFDMSRCEYMKMKKDEWRSKFDLYKERRAKRKKSS